MNLPTESVQTDRSDERKAHRPLQAHVDVPTDEQPSNTTCSPALARSEFVIQVRNGNFVLARTAPATPTRFDPEA